MYQLFIANKNYSSWSLRPWVLMKALGIEFEERLVPFEAENFERYRHFSPNGLVPCLHDGEIRVWDSFAIVEYLAERHPGVWPSDAPARAFARSAAAEMHAGYGTLRAICTMNCGVRARPKEMTPALQRDIARFCEVWTEGLQRFGGPFLAGSDFTAVDAFFAPVAYRVQTYGLELPPEAAAYAERLRQFPAMREWYEAAMAEPWREPGHEAEIAAVATIIADERQAVPASS
ncbi:glutathione S-transferase family protein [Consotaella aegiceratis]|uniref:glutathione S-transferase family protein n=1 Tax=Consotaella aegiceratis TaxID=3097961 RepID=UPI002F3E63A6